jgi:hypothetical protein
MLGDQSSKNLTSGLGATLTLAVLLSLGLGLPAGAPNAWGQTAQSSGRSDADIQSDVGYALSNSAALKGQQITAATVEGDVTISGNVRDDASKELAESLIYRVNGVRSVTNNLTVGDAAPQAQQAEVNGGSVAPAPNENAQQDPNYDPAQQNMAPVSPDAGANPPAQQPPPPQQQPSPQYQPAPQYQAAPQYQPRQPYPNYQQQALVTVPAGTLLQVRTSEPLDATRVQPDQVFQATVAADVYQGGALALPRGAVITGRVVATTSNKGDLAGRQGLSLTLSSINLGGQVYTLPTDTWSGRGPGKGGYSAANTIGGAGIGAVIGAIAGGGAGAAIGAGLGGAVGAGASAATTGPRMYLPAEAVVNFHLTEPLTVTPVSPQEAQRLASSAYPGQPQLRPRYGYGYPPPPPPPPYYYPYRYPVAYYPYYYYRY